MNWIDVCVIIIIVVNGIRGLAQGLIISVFNMTSFIIAAIVSKIYYSKLSQFIMNKTPLSVKIYEFILKRINETNIQSNMIDGQGQTNVFEMMNLPKTLGNLLMENEFLKEYNQEAMINIHNYIADATTKIIVDLLSIVIIFLGILLILNILGHILNSVASLPIINQFNRLGGLVFGTFKGTLIVFILLAIMVPVVSMFPNCFIEEALYKSTIAKDLYNYNILLRILGGFIANSGFFIL